MSLVAVRPAVAADAARIVEFNLAMALETEAKTLSPAVLRSGVERALADPARGRYFVAEVDGVVAGCLLVTSEWSDWRDGWFVAYTPSLVVGVWVGHDDGRPLNRAGSRSALPIGGGI